MDRKQADYRVPAHMECIEIAIKRGPDNENTFFLTIPFRE